MIVGFTMPEIAVSPVNLKEEADTITEFLQSGALDFFHIRKPEASPAEIERLIQSVPEHLHKRLVLHSGYILSEKFDIGGIHISHRNSAEKIPFDTNSLFLTQSCHTLAEIQELSDGNRKYVTLSPIFDSISKSGYKSHFNLEDADLKNVIQNKNVIALGGVTPRHFTNLFLSKFGGAALLGYLWQRDSSLKQKVDSLLANRKLAESLL